jgi:hypothetical protein
MEGKEREILSDRNLWLLCSPPRVVTVKISAADTSEANNVSETFIFLAGKEK